MSSVDWREAGWWAGEAGEDKSRLLISTYWGGPTNTCVMSFSTIHTLNNLL